MVLLSRRPIRFGTPGSTYGECSIQWTCHVVRPIALSPPHRPTLSTAPVTPGDTSPSHAAPSCRGCFSTSPTPLPDPLATTPALRAHPMTCALLAVGLVPASASVL